MKELKFGSCRRDVFKRHLLLGFCVVVVFHWIVTGAWSLMIMGCIVDSEIFGMIELELGVMDW